MDRYFIRSMESFLEPVFAKMSATCTKENTLLFSKHGDSCCIRTRICIPTYGNVAQLLPGWIILYYFTVANAGQFYA